MENIDLEGIGYERMLHCGASLSIELSFEKC